LTAISTILERHSLTWVEKLGALSVIFRDNGGETQFPLSHRFEPGLYIREVFIPKGTFFIGRAHRYGHKVTLDAGRVRLILEDGNRTHSVELEAPHELNTVPYFQTVFEALEDTWGSTYHPNPTNSRNIDALEADIFLPADDMFRIGESVLGRNQLPGIME
jgi:hypothetical protein